MFPKILAGKLGAALSTSISRCNPIASVKDHSLSPSAPAWGQLLSAEVFQELSLAETPTETQATYKTDAKSKFVRPEEGWRNHYMELRRFGQPSSTNHLQQRIKSAFYRKVRLPMA